MKTKLSALIISLFAAVSVYAAGDIYEIRPCDQYGINTSAYATRDNPLNSGSTNVYFNLRLKLRGEGSYVNKSGLKKWYQLDWLNYIPGEDPETSYRRLIEEMTNPLRIGIYVSGSLRFASLQNCYKNIASGTNYFDCVFMYQTQPGDFALPVFLAVKGADGNPSPAFNNTAAGEYYFDPVSLSAWRITYHDEPQPELAGPAVWIYADDTGKPIGKFPSGSTSGYRRVEDYTLEKAGIYVQTIDFDPKEWEDPTYWQTVDQTDTRTCYVKVDLDITNAVKNSRVYVWSMDESGVLVDGVPTEIVTNYIDGVKYATTNQVAEVVLDANGVGTFDITGIASNGIYKIVMSPWNHFNFKKSAVGSWSEYQDYVTALVKCEPPPEPSIQFSFDPIRATGAKAKTYSCEPAYDSLDGITNAIPVYVYVSEPPDVDPFEFTIKVKSGTAGLEGLDVISNHFIAVSRNGDQYQSTKSFETNITIKASMFGSNPYQDVFYIYPLGANPNTQSDGIILSVNLPTGSKYTTSSEDDITIKIKDKHNPIVVAEGTEIEYGERELTGFSANVEIAECERDFWLSQNTTNRFAVEVTPDSGTAYTTNLAFKVGSAIKVPILNYTRSATYAIIRITDPDCDHSVQFRINFTVKPQKTIKVDSWYDVNGSTTTLHEGTIFSEGGFALPKFAVSGDASDHDIYIFLEPQNAASSNLVACKAMSAKGIPLYAGTSSTELNDYFKLEFLDGCSQTDATDGQLSFRLVTRKGPAWTSEIDETYTAMPALINLTVRNVAPVHEGLYIAGNPNSVPNGSHFRTPISSSVTNSFVAAITDVSKIDVTNGLYVIWNFSEGYDFAPSYTYAWSFATNDTVQCLHAFDTEDATQTVQYVAIDKDMLAAFGGKSVLNNLETLWPRLVKQVGDAGVYKVSVYVSNRPYIKLVDEFDATSITVDENVGTTDGRTLKVSLSEPAKQNLKLEVKVKSYSDYTDPKDTGTLSFNTTVLTIKKGATTPSGDYKDLKYNYHNLDGAKGSMDSGFFVTISVKEPTALTNFYQRAEAEFFVNNCPPIISPKQTANISTNKSVAAGEPFSIEWSAKDEPIDLKNGLTAKWYVDDMIQNDLTVTGITSNQTYVTSNLVINAEGLHEVKLIVSDKDGEDYNGTAERIWLYYIAPTKKLQLRAFGPSFYTDSYYDTAAGLGKGRVYADGTRSLAEGFVQTWFYNVETADAQMYAAGYPSADAPYFDDGGLSAHDLAIDPNGNRATAAPFYEYDGKFDNYFYRWAYIGVGAEGGAATSQYSKVELQTVSGVEVIPAKYKLTPFEKDKTSYEIRSVEAIFSRELYADDNLGDINGDGVPDAYAKVYRFNVFDASGNMIGSDLDSLEFDNTDNDFYPMAGTAVFPGLSNSWMTAANVFTAYDEIRGYGQNLNHVINSKDYGYPKKIAKIVTEYATGNKISNVKYVQPLYDEVTGVLTNGSTLTELEYGAFVKWCERNELDPADEDNWKLWTPECPSDPTLDDTDSDGVPDGYEYYFWYRAHVGDPALSEGTNAVRMTGRRYVVAKPGEPEIITADEIEATFNPNQRNRGLDEQDTDNDGIPDLAEFALGTNPFDFDTDGDGLPDGFELLCSKTDPLKYATYGTTPDGTLNLDQDAMAYLETKEAYAIDAWEIIKNADNSETTNDVRLISFDEFAFDAETGKFTDKFRFYRSWIYGVNGPICRGADVGIGIELTNLVAQTGAEAFKTNVIEVHYQVYHHKSFDPRTAWNIWTVAELKPDGINTRPYTTADEHLLLGFWINEGLLQPVDYTPTKSLPLTTIWQKYTTACAEPADADTDADGIPDGWELYTMAGPQKFGPKKDGVTYHFLMVSWTALDPHSPLIPEFSIADKLKDVDGDGLKFQEEFSGMHSSAAYNLPWVDCPSVILCNPLWRNKIMPTDPWNGDTDGDGINDGAEFAKPFVYGSEGVAGGGLNPLSWDTDGDLLPDPFELEFAGSYSNGVDSTSMTIAEDGTTNTTVTAGTGAWKNDGMDGTVSDAMKDYDHDGLLNWQEYMVGAMRHFRYDDSVSQWGTSWDGANSIPSPDDEEAWGIYWYNVLVSPVKMDDTGTLIGGYSESSKTFNRYFQLDLGFFDASMAYFSLCTNDWDSAKNKFYMFKDGIYHDLKNPPPNMYVDKTTDPVTKLNRFMWKLYASGDLGLMMMCFKATNQVGYPETYICCDPTMPDTDGDGMDDYYELFHGLNPILGEPGTLSTVSKGPSGLKSCQSRDVIYQSYNYLVAPNAGGNWWMTAAPHENDPVTRSVNGYDFVNFPWLAGIGTADPDGDDARNYEEAIMPNIQATSTYFHTDPSPLWMTDGSYAGSFVNRYYHVLDPMMEMPMIEGVTREDFTFTNPWTGEKETYKFNDFPGIKWVKDGMLIETAYPGYNNWNLPMYGSMNDYEQNEGYDSDHDFLSDTEERVGKTKSASDPQDHDDPLRRQAMWFGGAEDPGFLETPMMTDEIYSDKEGATEPRENFEFFTAECWAKPDATTYNKSGYQVVLERSCYSGTASPNDSNFVRKNFIIGIHDGRWFAGFDSAGTALDRIEITDGPVATTNWTHVAATYDGVNLILYTNWEDEMRVNKKAVGRHPDHGMSAPMIDENGELVSINTPNWLTILGSPTIAINVGASIKTLWGHAFDYCNPMIHWTNIDDYGDFYRGYVDEVRIWDGARSQADIQADFKNRTRYTTELALANRQAVYEGWVKGQTRVENNIAGTLPPQLKYHWTFDHLAGAVKAEDVIKEPAGFATDGSMIDAKAVWCRPTDWVNPWRDSFHPSIKSVIYSNEAYVPWINDTVSHLPRFDGTTIDSCYWTEQTVGIQTAASLGYKKFAFNRSHEVYSKWSQMIYASGPATTPSRWENLQSLGGEIESRVQFTYRDSHSYGDDMLPFGSAFPKRISSTEGGMWDGQGAADAWAQTGTDANMDGLPDWWAQYALENYYEGEPTGTVSWNTVLNYNGEHMAAHEAYKRDLALGLLPDLEYHEEYADTRDLDLDGMPDWWEDLYGIDTGSTADALADPDHDGLSNYQEYLVGQKYGWYVLNPNLSATHDGQKDTDYFLRLDDAKLAAAKAVCPRAQAGMYLGEILADHDFLEDNDEKAIGTDYTRYDAYSDHDEDGWTAFAEHRYSDFKMGISARFVSHMNGEEEVIDAPVPVVHATIRYNGELVSATNAAIIVEAYSGNNLQKKPSAIYNITPGQKSVERYLNLGTYENRIIHGTLAPGHILAGEDQIKIQFFFVQPDDLYSWSVTTGTDVMNYTGTYAEMIDAMATYGTAFTLASQKLGWNDLVNNTEMLKYSDGAQQALQISVDEATQKGHLLLTGKRAGSIDLLTGDFDIDLSVISDLYVESTQIQLSQCFFRIAYTSVIPAEQTKALMLSLAKPDTGKLTEGATAFVAYMDKDGDGVFTPGVDPIGFQKDVQIGWDNVPELVIEMTDSSQAAGKRFSYATATNDTVRVVRIGVNGVTEGIQPRIIFSRDIAAVQRDYVFEGDLVSSGKYGLDWDNLRSDLQTMEGIKLKNVTSVEYAVIDGTGSMQNLDTNSFLTTFSVEYTSEAVKPAAYSPTEKADGIVETTRPTFRWTAADGYTAFRLQIFDAAGSVKLYDSDVRVLPARDASSRYTWTAPVFIGTNVTADAWALDNHKSYKWRVAMYNAKFSETTDGASLWSDWAVMRAELADMNDKSTRYGTVKTVVKYFGPATNSLDQVIVQLYKNADFTGTPVAQTRLFDVSGELEDLTNGVEVAFHGLEDGTYYACAFIDRNSADGTKGDCTRQRYETWGYSAQVGTSVAAIWNPQGIVSDAASVKIPTVTVYMEDTDVNGDDLLDCDQDEELLKASSTSTSESALAGDSDGDGLSDFDEGDKSYTKANVWDTDGDGMPDGWEYLFAGTDPLTPDADKVVAGELMAYAEYASRVLTVRSTATGVTETYIIPGTNEYHVGDNVNGEEFYSTYDYNGIYGRGKLVTVKDSEEYNLATITNNLGGAEYKIIFETTLPIGVGTNVNEETGWIPVGPDGGPYTLGSKTNLAVHAIGESNIVTAVEAIDISLGENRVIMLEDSAKVALVHAQVYDQFGFSQTTAVDPADEHTKPFTAIDKYLVIRYLAAIGIGPGEEEINKKQLWKYYSLVPTVLDGDGISDLEDAKSAVKGAKDATNKYGDGIDDGWELYVMFGSEGTTNAVIYATPAAAKISPWKYADRSVDLDADGLDLLHEYSEGKDPSNPWDPYSVYKLILEEGVIEEGTAPFLDSEVRRFGVKKDDVDDDWDLDMISNGQEVWGYYKDRKALFDICETNAWSDGITPDYFRALTNLTPVAYLGEIYNGAEFIEPRIRKLFDIQNLQRAGTRDLYNSGWDVWSIVRGSIYKNEQQGTGEISEELSYCVKFLYAVWPDQFNGATLDDVIQFVNANYSANVSTLDGVVSVLGGMDYIKRIVKEHAANSLDVAGFDIPEPEINVKFRYFGNGAHAIVIEAYQTSSTYPERGEQLTASWSVTPLFDSGTAYVTLKATGKGTLKQGKCRFVAYIDNDGSSNLSAADTYAVATANIGFAGAYVEMTLGDPNLGLPAFTFNDGSNFVSQIKIVRTHINGKPLLNPHTVFFRSYANNAQRQTVFPDDYIWWGIKSDDSAHYIGLDRNLAAYKNMFGGIDTVTYEVLEGVGPYTVSNLTEYAVLVSNQTTKGWIFSTNIVSGTGTDNKKFTVNYSRIRDVADVQVTADQLAGNEVTASFTIPTDTPATKFWLKFDDNTYPNGTVSLKNYAGSEVTYTAETGYPIPPAANGLVTIDLADYIGDEIDPGTHKVAIRLGNDMFGNTGDDYWSGTAEFSVGTKAQYKGKLDVIVKHPTANVGNITLAVYDRPDLANPVAEVKVGQSLNNVIEIGNLRENGEYYVAAWAVKSEDDGRASREDRMPYDTWGYVSAIGTITNGFNALAIKATAKITATNYVWMQDTDWNDNGIIDRNEDFVDRDALYTRGRGSNIIYKDDFDLDGLPDSYEEEEEPEEDDDILITGKDVMAYYEAQEMLFVGLSRDGGDSNLVWCAVVDRTAIDRSFTLNDGSIQLQTPASALGTLYSTYDYYNASAPRTDASKWQGIGTNVTYDSTWTVQRMRIGKAKFVHAQVYTLFGYNPKTCVGDLDAVNTKNFTRNDKYLVCRYLEAIGVEGVSEKGMSDSGNWIWALKANNKLDQDRDSVADGWELYVMFGPDTTKYNLVEGAGIVAADLTNSVPAEIVSPFDGRDGQAYSYADQKAFPAGTAETSTNLWLKIAQEFDNGQSPTDPWSVDSDKDGVADYIAFYYNVKGENAGKDDDGDGLSNYAEYLISEVFRFTKLDPKNPKTDGACVDYFRKVGDLYFGEMFTDHDQIDDAWEDLYGAAWANSGIFDPYDDQDGDGWSNFAEYMAGTDPTFGSRTLDVSNGVVVSELAFPIPEIEATVVYNGTANINNGSIVFKAWSDPYMTDIPDAIWLASVTSTNTPSISHGRSVIYTLTNPEMIDYTTSASTTTASTSDSDTSATVKKPSALLHSGGIHEGDNTFVVFADLDGNKMYTAGEPFGVVRNVNVGWKAAAFTVELTDTHPVFARLDITDAVNDRKEKYGTESGNWENVNEGHVSGGDFERVRVVRTLIDGFGVEDPILTNLGLKNGNRVVMDKWIDVANCRCVIHEGDFLTDGNFDLDWEHFNEDVGPIVGTWFSKIIGYEKDFYGNNKAVTQDTAILATSVVYRVVLGNGDISTALTNNIVGTAIVRRFDYSRDTAIAGCVDNDNSIVYSASPTFNWKMPNNANSYTAFKIEVANADTGATIYNSGLHIAPAMKNGMYSWTADGIVGSVIPKCGNFRWRVSMVNAKFRSDEWSGYASFSTAVNAQQPLNDHGYSSIGVCVKYTGPESVLSRLAVGGPGRLVVQAFESRDYSGVPVASAYATDKTLVADPSIITSNAELVGLDAQGTYYVRAFIDSNGNGVRDDFESWGSCSDKVTFSGLTTKPVVGFYLEDSDTDCDWLPDAWEYAQAGWSGSWDDVKTVRSANVMTDGKVLFSASNFNEASSKLTGISSYAKGASLTIFENGSVATMLLSGSGVSAGSWTIESIRNEVNKQVKVKEDSVRITGVSFDYATSKVHLFVGAEVAPTVAGSALSQIYSLPAGTTKQVTVKIYTKTSLAQAGWTLAETQTVNVGVNDAEVTLTTAVDPKSGFFRIEVCE